MKLNKLIISTILLIYTLTVSCRKEGSLTFVIDDTTSMGDDIAYVKKGVDKIMDAILKKSSQIENIVLVSFNEIRKRPYTKHLITTRVRHELKKVVGRMKVWNHGNYDCPEPSLHGIKEALDKSADNSQVFVFTDASPKDYELTKEVINLAQKKQSQVVFIVAYDGGCRERAHLFNPYEEIANATFGQVFRINSRSDIPEIIDFITQISSGDSGVIKSRQIPPRKREKVPFFIDDQTEYAIISTTGQDVELDLTEICGSVRCNARYERITWLRNVKAVKLINPSPGWYSVTTGSKSITSIKVIGRTDFTFHYGFSELPVSSLNGTDKNPTAGQKYHLAISVNDPGQAVLINAIQILDMNEKIITRLPLKRSGKDFYTTDLFLPPSSFLIAVQGVGIYSQINITRISKTPIESRMRNFAPIVSIDNIANEYEYNSKVFLNCYVKGYPEPQIEWTDENGNIVHTAIVKKTPPYEYTSQITVNAKKSQNFKCNARNLHGNNNKMVSVKVKSPFVIKKHPEVKPQIEKLKADIKIKKAQPVTLTCRIIKGFPIPKRVWQFKESGSSEWIILPHLEEQLTIDRTNLSSGDYKCVASNIAGHDELVVKLTVEAPPEIISLETTVYAVERDLFLRIPCDTVGYPKPTVTWTVNGSIIHAGDRYNFDKETLVINNPVHNDSKVYTCEVHNEFGSDNKTFIAIVTGNLPFANTDLDSTTPANSKIYKKKDNTHYILQGSNINLDCPHAKDDTIIWFKDGIYFTTGSHLEIKKATASNDGVFTCRVNNYHGTTSYTFNVDVGYGPRGSTDTSTVEKTGNDGQKINYLCDFDMKPETNYEWTFNGKTIDENTTDFSELNWGNYTCTVTNPHGTAKKHIYVTSFDCLIKKSEIKTNSPLILTEDSTWANIYYNEKYLRVPHNKKLKLFCPNQATPNQFKILPHSNEIIATCMNEDKFSINGEEYAFEDLKCEEQVQSVINKTGTKCLGENSELVTVGFKVDDFVKVFEVCFDSVKIVPLYTHVNMSPIYNSKNTHARTNRKIKGDNCGEGSRCCFGETQLVNERDVRYGPPQAATFMDMNYVPYWQSCNGNVSWSIVEDNIRNEGALTVWSGASHYASKDDLMVPRYLWKVVKSIEFGTADVIVYVNDPSPVVDDKLCGDICSETNLATSSESIYCCRLDEFCKAFNIPKSIFN